MNKKVNEYEFGMIFNQACEWHNQHFTELERKDNTDLSAIFKGNFGTFYKFFIELRDDYIQKGIYVNKEMEFQNQLKAQNQTKSDNGAVDIFNGQKPQNKPVSKPKAPDMDI